ncbi:hypothetical protein [Hymenobacter sp. GOD-10R]|uniref:hypothetical protein n=1 Tax=Hymenobacter sp. GOD-10R TaxID=3093922 RepID=UPI002D779D6C|nr:hypothetical protein [Hymenobacter sp. GOD-10R]WRQ30970.1 hypothetical protein SD425_11940 [Hymenobacter sp. GOD-10R]
MLDFFLIDDSQPRPNRNFNLEYIGGIEDELFYELRKEGIIEPWFDYYSDFRWGSEIIARILLKLQQRPKSAALQKEEKEFAAILQKAVDAKAGVLAFGD